MNLPMHLQPTSSVFPGQGKGRPAHARRAAAAVFVGTLALTGCSSGSAPAARPASASTAPSQSAPVSVPSPSANVGPTGTAVPSGEVAPSLGQPACAGSLLTVADADAVTAQGHLEEVFVVRTSGPDCQLVGYPGLTFVGAAGKVLAIEVDQGGHGLPPGGAAPVTLSRGTSMSFTVATARTGTCVATSRVRVTLPATTPALSVDTTMRICGSAVGVSPVQRRSDSD